MKISFINLIILSSILGTYFLAIPIFIVVSLGLSFVGFWIKFIYFNELKINGIGILILINFLYWGISGLTVGSFDLTALAMPSFYDGDARIFLSYIPFLFFCVSGSRTENIIFFINTIRKISIFSVSLFLTWLPSKPLFLSSGLAHNFSAFLTSHTGAGTFFGFLSIILFVYGYFTKSKFDLTLSLIMLLVVFGTGSRTTLLGLAVVGIWFILSNFEIKKFVFVSLATAVLLTLMPLVAQHTFNRTFSVLTSETFSLISEQIQVGQSDHWQPGDDDRELVSGDANILSRFVFWSYAIHRFIQSPWVGIGWGRYNDPNLQFSGSPGWIYMAMRGEQRFGAANAHNSYLMLLCESGLIGLFLFSLIWFSIYIQLSKAKQKFAQSISMQSYFIAAQASILFTLTAAMFGHALAAPSVCIPVLTFVGAGLSLHPVSRTAEQSFELESDPIRKRSIDKMLL